MRLKSLRQCAIVLCRGHSTFVIHRLIWYRAESPYSVSIYQQADDAASATIIMSERVITRAMSNTGVVLCQNVVMPTSMHGSAFLQCCQ